jgi:hypothetical protein
MTPTEILSRIRELKSTMSPDAEISMMIGSYVGSYVSVYPEGYGLGKTTKTFDFSSFKDVFDDITAWWADEKTSIYDVVIKKMALAIIRITNDQGECSDAALRMEFSDFYVRLLGTEAEAKANDMAQNGPFTIINTDLSNAA